jgi:dTDP-4-dehydrorhamnose 3,5-epimerase
MANVSTPKKDVQSVTPEGERISSLIDGVIVRMAVMHPDERGEICEIYNPAWGLTDKPLVYIYQIVIRPGKVKGWQMHHLQDDRLFLSIGAVKVVLYDDRPDSPTYQMINEICLTERNRGLVLIPMGVYHALQNIGDKEAVLVNSPTEPYNHANPDKYRLSLDNDKIPYSFEPKLGW